MAVCARLVDHLPGKLQGLGTRVVRPRSPLVHVWGGRPVVLRCGVPKPAGYDPFSAQATEVDGVTWFQRVQGGRVTWTAVRHDVNVELVVPTSYAAQGGFLVEIGAAIRASLP